ncbi:MAG TPA: hypothetical protein VGJ75_18285 [Dongiaceae bacterium]|jgi:hypothetical protein
MTLRCVLLLAALLLMGGAALAADDSLQKPLYEVCRRQDAGWIGKGEQEIKTNCTCKAKSESAMATPAFRDSLLKNGVYDPLLIGDPDKYMARVLKDCPALQQRMIDAMCKDPAAPPDACAAVKDMISKLK